MKIIFPSIRSFWIDQRLILYTAVLIASLLVNYFLSAISLIVVLAYIIVSYLVCIFYRYNVKALQIYGFSLIGILFSYKVFITHIAPNLSGFFQGFSILGISYYTFKITSLVFDLSRNPQMEVKFDKFLLFCVLTPLYVGDPILKYQNFEVKENFNLDNITYGIARIGLGIIKKIIIVDILINNARSIVKLPLLSDAMVDLSLSMYFVYILSFGFIGILHAYIDISAWTDVSIGISRLLGYDIPENMNRPLLAKNIVSFWQRYHMTIVNWVKEYIFSPLLFLTRNPIPAIFFTMLFMGVWHKPSLLWLIWAMGHSIGIITCSYWQKLPLGKFLAAQIGWKSHIIGVLSWFITFFYMSLIFIFIQCENLAEACKVYSRLFH